MNKLPHTPPTSEQESFRELLDAEIEGFLATQREILSSIAADAGELLEAVSGLVTGGKRLRALLCYWGWRGAGGAALAKEAVLAGLSLELFQAAALIHDDIIDRSDTRRGGPSVHRRFALLHQGQGWALDAERFGQASAILAGDLCLSFSEEAFAAIGERVSSGTSARRIFNTMRTEVMAGQYLDVLEEAAGPSRDRAQAVPRAQAIIRYKSAKYSTEHPLGIGGALAGGDNDLLAAYSEFSLPLGEAFQLRDDVLGVFGNPRTTGKPAGDDLREGKRTVLIALTLEKATPEDAARLESKLGRQDLDEKDVDELRALIEETGALAATEALIEEHSVRAAKVLERLPLTPEVRQALERLAEAAVRRIS